MSPSRGTGRGGAPSEVERADEEAQEEAVAEGGGRPAPRTGRGRAEDAPGVDPGTRGRVAVETFARHEASLRRTAGRYSICADDADEALQRALEILLRKAPSEDPRELVRWTQTVVKHEALAVRAERERILAGPAAATPEPGREDWVAMLPTDLAGPAERAERHEAVERSREALATLKPQELRALGLLAEGYSYREIGEITGFSATKVNRCVAEGRERFRRFLARREGGARCAELAPLLSAFADEEAEPADVETLREHLRTCAHCRSTLRAYRAAPGAVGALLPALPPLRASLLDQLHDVYAALATRVGGGSGASDSTLGGVAVTGGTRGAGAAALAKVLAVCAGTVGGAAACVASGVVPAPLLDPPDQPARAVRPAARVVHHRPRHRAAQTLSGPTIEYAPSPEPEPEPASQAAEPTPQPEDQAPEPEVEEAVAPEEVAAAMPPSESGAVEYTEPPPPPAAPSSTPAPSSGGASHASSSGSAAGEFGP